MARSVPPSPSDPSALIEVIQAFRQMSTSMAEYAQDLGRLAEGHRHLDQSIILLTQHVTDISRILQSTEGKGVLFSLEVLRRDMEGVQGRVKRLEDVGTESTKQRMTLIGTVITTIGAVIAAAIALWK